jgi:hypothetical protein
MNENKKLKEELNVPTLLVERESAWSGKCELSHVLEQNLLKFQH